MARTSLRAVSLAFLMCIPAGVSWAGVVDATSHVTEATIYTDRALVTRAIKVHVPAGAQTISVTDLPAGLNEATLRVQGSALAGVKIGTVEVKHVFLTDLANAAERDKQAQIDAKTNEKAMVQAEVEALKAKEKFITRIVEAGALKHDDAGAKLDFAPEKWQQAWNLIQTGMGDTEKELAAKTIAIAKIDQDIAKLQEELAQIQSQQAKERRDAKIAVEAAADTDLNLTLSYQTSGASWRPVYDARLETGDAQLNLEQYGSVTQSTGEDWDDVALTLSTAQPASGSEMPRLNEWWVRLFQPVVAQMAAARMDAVSVRSYAAAPAPMAMMKGAGSSGANTAAEPVAAEQVEASAATTEYSAEFKVPGHVALKSTRDNTKLYLGAVKMKAVLEAQATPRLSPQAYLFAKVTNDETYPLIPGLVSKFRDGSFIGNAQLDLLRAGEEAKFSFGVDDRIKVDYKHLKDKQDNPALMLVGDMSVERQDQTKVQNLHKEPVTVTVFDQYPTSTDADVKVDVNDDETTAGYVPDPDKRQGVIAWTAIYTPQEEKTFTLGFKVKYPKGRNIQGM